MAATLPALVPDFIETTFANAGTVTKPPQTDPNGFVNFQDGYGADYELDLDSGNTEAKGVERADQNYLFAQSTIMAQWWQSMGLAPWYSTMANGGVAGYNAGALVGRVSATTNEWVIWRSLQDANTVDPNTSNQTAWDYVPTDSDLTTLFAMPAGGTGQKLLPGGQTTEQILTATNFNSLVTGTFEYVSDAIANGSANTPSSHAGMVECKLWSNASVTYGVQRYCDRTGSIFIRGMQNGSWTAWSSFVLTYAAIVAALGYVPANSAVTITANNGLTGGGSLAANMTIGLAPIAQSTILANPTAASGVPIACTLLNGIILNSPANTLGLGTITPVNVASQGFVSGTTGTFSGGISATTGTFSGAVSGTTATFTGNGDVQGFLSVNQTNAAATPLDVQTGAGRLLFETLSISSTTLNSIGSVNTANSSFTSFAFNAPTFIHTGSVVVNSTSVLSPAGALDVSISGAGRILFTSSGSNNSINSVNAANSAFTNLSFTAASYIFNSGPVTISGQPLTVGTSLSVGTKISCQQLFVNNNTGAFTTQGGYMQWNFSGGSGETDFVNNEGGGSGGFNWYNTNSSGSTVTQIMSITGGGDLQTAGTIQAGSDGRLKKNRHKITGALALVAKLTGMIYERSDRGNKIESGFIAQSVERHFPHLVTKNKVVNGIRNFRTLNYNGVVPYLANAITELHEAVSKTFRVVYIDMRRELRERDKKIEALERRLSKLESTR